ncbi:hypothetical protein [Jiella pacifica]|uniref:Uncharacterized protein n=1 Tax=Jiella pacifica TaxID=2696469 RepID=A0A6N9SXN6_9HYPH|nr:hypothetical protein [Jiella pacifica]NDW03551.1 hypothetical protein [Jiella pacifica]
MQCLSPPSRAFDRPFVTASKTIFAAILLAGMFAALPLPLAMAQTAPKSEERLTAKPDALAEHKIATIESDAWMRIASPLAPTRLSLVLAPSAIDPAATVFIDVYLQPVGDETESGEESAPGPARLTEADRSRLAGTVAFTEADTVGEEEYFVVNVPPGMRFESGAAIVTITLAGTLAGADAPPANSAVELRRANLLR